MKLNLGHALDYLKNARCKMSERTYYRHNKKIQELKSERMRFIAKIAYEEQHLKRIDRMELIENQVWLSYWREKAHTKKVKIPSEIASIQPYISSCVRIQQGLNRRQRSKNKGFRTKTSRSHNG